MADGDGTGDGTGDGEGQQQQQQQETPWFSEASDEVKGYLENRGLNTKTAAEAALATIDAHRAAEAKLGVPADQLLRLPKNAEDAEGRNALFTKLGRPTEAKDYGLGEVPDTDDKFVEFFGPVAHKAGLTKDQAIEVTRALAELTKTSGAAETDAQAAAYQVEKDDVARDWGANAASHALTVEKAFKALNFTEEQVGGLVSVLGYKETMTKFLEIGSKLGEDVFITNQLPGGTGGKFTRQGAQERIAQLKNDPTYTEAYLKGDEAKGREMADLHRIAFG